MIAHPILAKREFLAEMGRDPYFPNHLVGRGVAVLRELCERIELEQPADLVALTRLTHEATESFNRLQEAFDDEGSEIETVARETIASDFEFIARAYGFEHADVEELIAPRDW